MIDLDALADAVGLPAEAAATLAYRAAIALERRHRPGTRIAVAVNEEPASHIVVRWRPRGESEAIYQDDKRVTEEGAEALALAVACRSGGWRVQRRLQSRLSEGADWLLGNATGARMVLEIGGTDERSVGTLLAEKIEQARRSPFAGRARPAACAVRFLDPSAKMWTDDEPR